jgi:hypothetical protein
MDVLVSVITGRPHIRLAGIASLATGTLAAALLAPPVQAQETGAATAAPGLVNIELILDVSGSMAKPVA